MHVPPAECDTGIHRGGAGHVTAYYSRYVAVLIPLVKVVLEEFVPDATEAIEIVRGKVVLVDGTSTPCWCYAQHPELWNGKHKTTGFNAQLISLLDGTAVWISDLCVQRISSMALTSRVASQPSDRDDHRSCACGSCFS